MCPSLRIVLNNQYRQEGLKLHLLLKLTPTNERRLYVRKRHTRKLSPCIFSHRVKVASRHRYISVPCHWPCLSFLWVANTVCCYHPSICLNNFNMLLLDAESKGFTTTTSRKSIDCSRAKVGKISQLYDNNWKEIFAQILKLTRINYKNYHIPNFCIRKKCLITSKLNHLIHQVATLSTKDTYYAITKYVHINGKVCAHLRPSFRTYCHIKYYPITRKKPSLSHDTLS